MEYSEKLMELFMNPKNVGALDEDDPHVGTGVVGSPVCGDVMKFQIKVDDEGCIIDAKFKTFGCGSAIATSSMVTELAKGKHADEAMEITRGDVASELDGLPPQKMHCSNLAADALHEAVKDYMSKKESPEKTGIKRGKATG